MSETNDNDSNNSIALGGQYMSFILGKQTFAIPILTVKEIISLMSITPIPRIPSDYRGVINLRGTIIPVVDLRIRFGMDAKPDDNDMGIIVIYLEEETRTIELGVIIDDVQEVLDIAQDDIGPVPEFGESVETEFLLGLYQKGEEVISLLDIEKALSIKEIENISKINQKTNK